MKKLNKYSALHLSNERFAKSNLRLLSHNAKLKDEIKELKSIIKKKKTIKVIVADRYMTLDSVKPNKDCTQGCDIHNDYTCFECEDIQIRKVYPNAIYNDDCQWEIKESTKK